MMQILHPRGNYNFLDKSRAQAGRQWFLVSLMTDGTNGPASEALGGNLICSQTASILSLGLLSRKYLLCGPLREILLT